MRKAGVIGAGTALFMSALWACDKADLVKDAAVVVLGQVTEREQKGVNPYQLQVTYHLKPLQVFKGASQPQYEVTTMEVPPIYMTDPKTGQTKAVDVNDSLGSSPWRPKPGDGTTYLLVLGQEGKGPMHLAKNHPEAVKILTQFDEPGARHVMGLALREAGRKAPVASRPSATGTSLLLHAPAIAVWRDQGKGYQPAAESTLIRGEAVGKGWRVVSAPGEEIKDSLIGRWSMDLPSGTGKFGDVTFELGDVKGAGWLTVDFVNAAGEAVYCGKPMVMEPGLSNKTLVLYPDDFWPAQGSGRVPTAFDASAVHGVRCEIRGMLTLGVKGVSVFPVKDKKVKEAK